MKSTPAMELFFRRQQSTLINVRKQLEELYEFSRALHPFSTLLQHWFLSSDRGRAEALMYEAFDADGPTPGALAVLDQRARGATDMRSIALWNGADADSENAMLSSRTNVMGRPDTVEFSLRLRPEVPDWQTPVFWLQKAISIWNPSVVTFGPYWYSDQKVFEDRPGVGWMLYLPKVLTPQQVPEARGFVPVTVQDVNGKERQLGTIILTVTDEAFSDENPEHVRIANAIEIRLADQDLLPRFSEL